MGWAVGFDENWKRDVGYGVPAICDAPGCDAQIDRGLAYVCADSEPFGDNGGHGCGLYFCPRHLSHSNAAKKLASCCLRCSTGRAPFKPKSDAIEWTLHKLVDPSWRKWREADQVGLKRARLDAVLNRWSKMPMAHAMVIVENWDVFRAIVDEAWRERSESEEVPDTDWADRIIARALFEGKKE